ncbi:unnamed protein product [Diamesa hyperborea]
MVRVFILFFLFSAFGALINVSGKPSLGNYPPTLLFVGGSTIRDYYLRNQFQYIPVHTTTTTATTTINTSEQDPNEITEIQENSPTTMKQDDTTTATLNTTTQVSNETTEKPVSVTTKIPLKTTKKPISITTKVPNDDDDDYGQFDIVFAPGRSGSAILSLFG